MKKTINYCGNCPFYCPFYEDYDEIGLGGASCNLAIFQKKEEYYIPNDTLDTPEWCPLKEDEYSFKFKEFSEKRLKNISSVSSKIKVLEGDVENEDKVSDELLNLYSDLSDLCENEELDKIEQEYDIDISNQVNDIREQLSALENAGDRLKKAFNSINLDVDEDNKD